MKGDARGGLWVKTDIAVWTVVVGGSAWVTAHGGRAISFGVILFVWASYRLAGSAALSRLDVAKAASESRLETVGGWLYISRRAFSGALFVALGVDAVVTHPSRGGIVFGVIGCGFGLPFVVLGLTFIRRWMQRRANPPVSGTRSVG